MEDRCRDRRLAERARAAEELRDECADILLLLLLVADKAGIDLPAAAWDKLAKNERNTRSPRLTARGPKYTGSAEFSGKKGRRLQVDSLSSVYFAPSPWASSSVRRGRVSCSFFRASMAG